MPQHRRSVRDRLGPLSGILAALFLTACATTTGGRGTAADHPAAATASATTPSTSTRSPASGHQCAYQRSGSAARDVGVPPGTAAAAPKILFLRVAVGAGKAPATIVIALAAKRVPCTVNSIAFLAAARFFDRTPCHRLTTTGIFVLQCGDPTGSGTGGPGYIFADEVVGNEHYSAGVVAMANAGPGTNGSQFFIVYRSSPSLPANYTIFGTVVSGLDVVVKIAAGGVDGSSGSAADGHPTIPVEIARAAVR